MIIYIVIYIYFSQKEEQYFQDRIDDVLPLISWCLTF